MMVNPVTALRLILPLLASLLACSAQARAPTPQPTPQVSVSELPREARETLALIERGGPFPYRKDGAVFGNYERRLPPRPRGYYREYTVPTPNARDRGARRIVAGGGNAAKARTSSVYYYTEDHYRTFRKVVE